METRTATNLVSLLPHLVSLIEKYLKGHYDEMHRSWSGRVRGQDKGLQQMWPKSLCCPSQLGDLGPVPQFVAL